jgi:hypothetical protein
MHRKLFSFLAVAILTACILTPEQARAFGLGGLLGMVTAPLRMIPHGAPHGHRSMHHLPVASAHALAAAETAREAPPRHAAREGAPEPRRTEARAEPPRSEPPGNDLQAVPQAPPQGSPMPPAVWPAASASVYEDLLGYILWPRDYADKLWAHGYDDIMGAVLTPVAAARSSQAAGVIAAGMCSSQAQDLADKPIARISQIIALADEQRSALDELRVALRQAIERGRATLCGDPSEPPAGEPLKPMLDGLWTMWDATILMRAPLEKFYGSLSPAQKMWIGKAGEMAGAAAAACADQHADQQRSDLSDRIAQAISAAGGHDPGPDQRRKLEALRQQFSELAKFLAASCPRVNEPNPISRLSAAGERMTALMYVVANMSPAVNALRASNETPR